MISCKGTSFVVKVIIIVSCLFLGSSLSGAEVVGAPRNFTGAPPNVASQVNIERGLTAEEVNDRIDNLCEANNFRYFGLMKWLAFKESSTGQNHSCGDKGFSCGLYQYKKNTWKEFQNQFNRYDLHRDNDMDQIEMTIIALKHNKWRHWGPLKRKYKVNPIQ